MHRHTRATMKRPRWPGSRPSRAPAGWLALAGALALALAGCAGDGTSATLPTADAEELATRTRSSFSGAGFIASEWTPCTYTTISIDAGTHESSSGSGRPDRWTQAGIWYASYETCGGWYPVLEVSGWASIDARDFRTTGKLAGAQLRTTLAAVDWTSMEPVDVAIDLVWTGRGDVVEFKHRSDEDWGGTKHRSRTVESHRTADVAGTVALGTAAPTALSGTGWLTSGSGSWMTNDGGRNRPRAPEIVAFDVWPYQIMEGGTAWLSWWVAGTEPITLTLDGGVGDVTGSTHAMVSPSETTTYTLTATNRRGSATAQVTVHVIPPPPPDGLDNHDRDSAHEIVLPYSSPQLSILPGEVDWFAFELTEATIVRAAVTAWSTGSTLDAMLALYDESNAQIAFNDDAFGLDPRIDVALAPGRYLLAVTGFWDHEFVGSHTQAGVYWLSVGPLPPPPDDMFEPNDSRDAAESIELGLWADLTLTAGDVDWFRFEVTDPLTVVAAVWPSWYGAAVDALLVLTSADGTVLALADPPGADLHPYLEVALAPGTYHLGVSGTGDHDLTGLHTQIGYYLLELYGY